MTIPRLFAIGFIFFCACVAWSTLGASVVSRTGESDQRLDKEVAQLHLLLAYLVDHVNIHASFAVAAAVSVFLVVSYLRLVAGWRLAMLEAGVTQIVFLVLFSYAFFFEGYTGLTVTVGAVITLFVLMQMTGHVKWDEPLPGLPQRQPGQ